MWMKDAPGPRPYGRVVSTVVVGGGVVGLCTAYYLRAAGEDVTVIDAGSPGGAASWGNAGWIVPSLSGPIPDSGVLSYVARSVLTPRSPLYLRPHVEGGLLPWLWRFARSCTRRRHLEGFHATARLGGRTMELFDRLRADGVVFDMWERGLLFVSLSEAEARRHLESLRAAETYGYRLPSAPSVRSELAEVEPALSRRVAAGFFLSGERHVDPRSLTVGLADSLRGDGVTFMDNTAVLGFERTNGHIHALRTERGALDVDAVVIAAGAWSGKLAKPLGVALPMKAAKGYSFSVSPEIVPSRPLYLLEAKAGVTPFGDAIRVAGTMELCGLDERVNLRRLDALRSSAARFVSGIHGNVVGEPWAGLRPLTPDGLPVIGRAPGIDNAYLATGHAMLGVTLGPATGQALARMITRDESDPVLVPFDPTRFAAHASSNGRAPVRSIRRRTA
jgi:D-amino-acid dehydrogenase